MSLEDKPRTGKLLRSFSNSFKKGTASLKRGLTPRSRTSSQTQELEAALPPPAPEVPREAQEAPAPAPAPSKQQPGVLEKPRARQDSGGELAAQCFTQPLACSRTSTKTCCLEVASQSPAARASGNQLQAENGEVSCCLRAAAVPVSYTVKAYF